MTWNARKASKSGRRNQKATDRRTTAFIKARQRDMQSFVIVTDLISIRWSRNTAPSARMGWSEKLTLDDMRAPPPLQVTVRLVGDPAPAPKTIEHESQGRSGYDVAGRHVKLVG